MSNGGYIMIDFSGLSLSTSAVQTIDGIYQNIEKALQTKKPVIAYNLTFNNIPVYYRVVNIVKSADNIILTSDSIQITVYANDAVAVTSTIGITDYEDLDNLPKINSVELKGNLTLAELGAATTSDIAALQPVDSVTDGEQKAVTSNAVYDYENEYAEVVAVEGDTRKTLYNKLNTIVDWSKVGRNSHLVSGSGYTYFYAGGHNFLLIMQTYSDSNVVLEIDKALLDNSNSSHRMVFYRTGVGSGSFSSITGNVDDYSNTEVPAGQKYRVYYR